jgi:hypothetical protein
VPGCNTINYCYQNTEKKRELPGQFFFPGSFWATRYDAPARPAKTSHLFLSDDHGNISGNNYKQQDKNALRQLVSLERLMSIFQQQDCRSVRKYPSLFHPDDGRILNGAKNP